MIAEGSLKMKKFIIWSLIIFFGIFFMCLVAEYPEAVTYWFIVIEAWMLGEGWVLIPVLLAILLGVAIYKIVIFKPNQGQE